ncbi:MAG: type II toxin-antitoxin system RelE/ParE family toxin [Nanoarchaeota archaeon]
MVRAIFSEEFKKVFSKIKDQGLKKRLIKQFEKIRQNPEVGKPMRNIRKGTRELYVKPFRLSYVYIQEQNKIIFLDLYHKDEQ